MKDDRLYLIHILESIERIYLGRLGTISIRQKDSRNLQIIAESTQRISPELKNAHF